MSNRSNDYHYQFLAIVRSSLGILESYTNLELMTMEANKLTVLACSGSILAATLFGSPSYGMPVQSTKGGERQIASLAVRAGHSTKIRQSDRNEQSLLSASYQRRLQLAAFTKFGCGCPNCVSAIRELVKPL